MKHLALGPLIIGISGTTLTPDDIERLQHPSVGGVILFTRNFESKDQLIALTDDIHGLRSTPLVIFVDHEGGRVQRFKEGFTKIPAMATLVKRYDESPGAALKVASQVGFVLAAELRACGVDMSFTPVLDIDYGRSEVIGDRSLGKDPVVVTQLAKSLLHGMSLAGMRGCGKHFPGHGWAEADSHFAVPVDDRPLEEILGKDAAPYGLLGSLTLASVMPAHVIYTAVDTLPAGFSPKWIKQILREQLGYQGAVISDDLGMAGAYVAGDIIARAKAALNAGCDAILACNDFDDIATLVEATLSMPDKASAARLERLLPNTLALSDAELLKHPEYLAAIDAIARLS